MKHLRRILIWGLCAGALAACSDDDNSRIPATAVVLDCIEKDLIIDESFQLAAKLTPADATDRVVWSSDNTAVATVSESGLVTAVAVGTATVKATCGKVSATCTVRVNAAASDDYDVISFETDEGMLDAAEMPVELRDVTIAGAWAGGDFSNVLCGKEYMMEEDFNGAFFDGLLFTTADRKVGFGSYFTDNQYNGVFDTWGGFVLSRNFSKEDNGGFADYKKAGFSAWATTAAGESATFAIAYDNGYGVYDYHTPKIRFEEPRTVSYLYMANATVTAQYTSPREDYWFKVVATGYRDGAAGKSVEQVLVSGKTIVGDWVKVDCESLGEIDELRFKVESNDMSGIYLNCPSYFCIDEIALVK